jgi:predicted lactoylglutathione lyase
MKPKKIWANFSVKDVSRTNKFYTELGFRPNGKNDYPKLASFLFGDDDFIIHFFEQNSQIDEYLKPDTRNGSEVIFTFSADSEAEIKEWEEKVQAAGGNVFQQAGRDKTGYYSFGFTDPDGHRFNVLLIEAGM